MTRFGIAPQAAAVALALLLPTSASADFAGDFSGLVAAIDASPKWIATAHDVVPNGDGGTVGGLSIQAEDSLLRMDLRGLVVRGYSKKESAGFSTASVEVQTIGFELGPVGFTLDAARLQDLAIGTFPAIDATRPLTVVAKIYGALAKATLGSGHVDGATVRSAQGGAHADVTYRGMEFGPLRNGILAKFDIDTIRTEASDARSNVSFQAGRSETRDINFDAFAHVFDPDRYANGIGDWQWRDAVGLVRYRDLAFTLPDGKVEIGNLFMENQRVRQPQASFTPAIDELMQRPDISEEEAQALLAPHVVDMLSAFAIGRMGFDELSFAGPAIDRFRLGGYRLIDASIARIGEIAVSDIEVAIPEAGEFTMHRFSVGDITLPDIAVLRRLAAAPDDDPGEALLPRPGFVEAIGVRAFSPGRADVSLDRARLDMSGFIGMFPTSVTADLNGLSVDTSAITDRRIRAVLSRLGYDRLAADYSYRMFWREIDERLIIDGFSVKVGNAGSVKINVELSGLTREDLANPDRLPEALDRLKLENAAVRVTDDSLLNRVFQMQAKELGIEPQLLKEQMTGALPFFLLPLGNPAFAGKLAPALRDFVMAPGTLLMTSRPGVPVPIADLISAIRSAPQTLPDLLGVDVRAQ